MKSGFCRWKGYGSSPLVKASGSPSLVKPFDDSRPEPEVKQYSMVLLQGSTVVVVGPQEVNMLEAIAPRFAAAIGVSKVDTQVMVETSFRI